MSIRSHPTVNTSCDVAPHYNDTSTVLWGSHSFARVDYICMKTQKHWHTWFNSTDLTRVYFQLDFILRVRGSYGLTTTLRCTYKVMWSTLYVVDPRNNFTIGGWQSKKVASDDGTLATIWQVAKVILIIMTLDRYLCHIESMIDDFLAL